MLRDAIKAVSNLLITVFLIGFILGAFLVYNSDNVKDSPSGTCSTVQQP